MANRRPFVRGEAVEVVESAAEFVRVRLPGGEIVEVAPHEVVWRDEVDGL